MIALLVTSLGLFVAPAVFFFKRRAQLQMRREAHYWPWGKEVYLLHGTMCAVLASHGWKADDRLLQWVAPNGRRVKHNSMVTACTGGERHAVALTKRCVEAGEESI